ncbi:MAG: T9SS type A sorting domain-containing protein [Bacteroidota bacterium]
MQICRTMLMLSLGLLLAAPSAAQWVQTGPPGGEIVALASGGLGTFVLPQAGALHRLGGNTWEQGGFEMTDTELLSLASGRWLFAGSFNGAFRSSDLGASWTHIPPASLGATAVFAMAADDSVVLAGTDQGVYRSLDNGLTWVPSGGGLPLRRILALHTGPRGAYAGLFQGGVWFSSDRGATWSQRGDELLNLHVTAIHEGDSLLYAGTNLAGPGGIFVSSDGGDHWDSAGYLGSAIRCLLEDSTGIYAGTEDSGVFRRHPATALWAPVNEGLTSFRISGLVRAGSHLLAASRDGVHASPTGDAWTDFNEGLYVHDIRAVGKSGCRMVAATPWSGIFFSSDCGLSWSRSTMLPRRVPANCFLEWGGVWYAGVGTGTGILRSTDGGGSWAPAPGAMQGFVLDMAATDSLLFAAGRGLFRHVAGSSVWDSLPVGGSSVEGVVAFDSLVVAGTTGPWPLGIRRSTDYGETWTTCNTGLRDINIRCLAGRRERLYAGTWYEGAFVSGDGGLTWSACGPGTGQGYFVYDIAVGEGEAVFAGVSAEGLHFSQNGGVSWRQIAPGVPAHWIGSIECVGDTVYAGTWGYGLRKAAVGALVTGMGRPPLPEEALTAEAYPNPFNARVTITYTIPVRMQATVALYDLLGREVRRLVSGPAEGGRHTVVWDAAGCASGVYFVRVSAGASHLTRGLLLLR